MKPHTAFVNEMARRSGLSTRTIRRDLKAGKLSYNNGEPLNPRELIRWLHLRRWDCSPVELKNLFDQLVEQYPEAL